MSTAKETCSGHPLAACALDALIARICAGADDPDPAPSAVIIVAHPDDEVLGAGGRLPRLREATLLHVTDGAPRDMRDAVSAGFATRRDYALARRRELLAALTLAGIGPEQTLALELVDQEASLHLVELTRAVEDLFRRRKPEVVITHPYEGGHPDHDATAFAVHAACRLLCEQALHPPLLLEMTSYHNRAGAMAVYAFLTHPASQVTTLVLSPDEGARKRQMLACYVTQQNVVHAFPVAVERFRPAPRYDFTHPPHEGLLWYECFDWGMTGTRWRSLARQALRTLGLNAL